MTSAAAPAEAVLDDAPPALTPVLALAFVLAACSLLYELIAAQALSLVASNTVVWYSLVVGVFLASMGIGSFRSSRIGAEGGERRALLRVEILLALCGAAAVPVIRLAHAAFSHLSMIQHETLALTAFFVPSAAMVVATGILTGIELPLLMRIARTVRKDNRSPNLVLGIDYLGSLAGALLFPLVVLPNMGVLAAGLAVAAVNLLAAVWLIETRTWTGRRLLPRIAAWSALALVLVGIANVDRAEQYFLRRFFYRMQLGQTWDERFAPRADLPPVKHARSAYQNIDLLTDVTQDFAAHLMPAYSDKLSVEPSFPAHHVLFLNGDFQTHTGFEEVYHEWFAHVPPAAAGRVPRSVLLLGGGDGLLLREIEKYPQVRRIRHVDLDPVLVTLAKNDPVLRRANHDAFRDPRVETTFEDGYQFVRRTTETFDAVYVDFPYAVNYDLAKLYSREFFEFVRQRVAPGGYAVFDATGTSLLTSRNEQGQRFVTPDNDWPIYYATLRAAGWRTIVPYLTTLELDNPRAREILSRFRLDARLERDLAAIADPAERDRRRTEARTELVDRYMRAFSRQLEQGFILLFPDEREVRPEFTDAGIPLYVLNAERYSHAFDVVMPHPETIDPSKVNSILRPTLPRRPWWEPRIGY